MALLSTAEELRETRLSISALESEVRHRRIMLENTEIFELELKKAQKTLDCAMARVKYWTDMREGGEEALYPMFDRINSLKAKESVLLNKNLVEKMANLQAALMSLSEELDPETLANIDRMNEERRNG
jgi:hypothetical protein